jgi:hypothetical protein
MLCTRQEEGATQSISLLIIRVVRWRVQIGSARAFLKGGFDFFIRAFKRLEGRAVTVSRGAKAPIFLSQLSHKARIVLSCLGSAFLRAQLGQTTSIVAPLCLQATDFLPSAIQVILQR